MHLRFNCKGKKGRKGASRGGVRQMANVMKIFYHFFGTPPCGQWQLWYKGIRNFASFFPYPNQIQVEISTFSLISFTFKYSRYICWGKMTIFRLSFSISLQIKRTKVRVVFCQIFHTKNEVKYLENYYFRVQKRFFQTYKSKSHSIYKTKFLRPVL